MSTDETESAVYLTIKRELRLEILIWGIIGLLGATFAILQVVEKGEKGDPGNDGVSPSAESVAAAMAANGALDDLLGRKVSVAYGLGPIDKRDSGNIEGRVLRFEVGKDDAWVRFLYTDNFRVTRPTDDGNDAVPRACRWELLVDGKSCSPESIVLDKHGFDNEHDPGAVVGYCRLAKGQHIVTVNVDPHPSDKFENVKNNCHTGWSNSSWVIEAEESNGFDVLIEGASSNQ
ncbi:MAG: hypothetical protein AAFN07_12015 [Pseudomonadota bacterium]